MRFATILILAALLGSPAAAQTGSNPSPLDPLYQCASIAAEAERLACYDHAVASLRSDAEQGRILAVDSAAVEEMQRESFGFDLPVLARMFQGDADAITGVDAQIERVYSLGGFGTFQLSNGQTWQQTERGRYNNVRAGDTVSVHQAAFGSYMLRAQRGQGHRVRRVD